jgi:hypothetical protein
MARSEGLLTSVQALIVVIVCCRGVMAGSWRIRAAEPRTSMAGVAADLQAAVASMPKQGRRWEPGQATAPQACLYRALQHACPAGAWPERACPTSRAACCSLHPQPPRPHPRCPVGYNMKQSSQDATTLDFYATIVQRFGADSRPAHELVPATELPSAAGRAVTLPVLDALPRGELEPGEVEALTERALALERVAVANAAAADSASSATAPTAKPEVADVSPTTSD